MKRGYKAKLKLAAEGTGLGRKSAEQRLKDRGAAISLKTHSTRGEKRWGRVRRHDKRREETWEERKARGSRGGEGKKREQR